MAHEGIPFQGFASEPVYSLRTLRGIKSLMKLAKAVSAARQSLDADRPDLIFSTGGYGAAPAGFAAGKLGIPVVLHEQNTVPSRANLLMAKHASCVCTVFRGAEKHFPGSRVVRTGMPIRRELREAALKAPETGDSIFVFGGSQGAKVISEAAITASLSGNDLKCIVALGKSGADNALGADPTRVETHPYLSASGMADAFSRSFAVASRAGGSLAEIAAFRRPSLLVPLPIAFADHQTHNAREFVEMGAATLIPQPELSPETLRDALLEWKSDEERTAKARAALAEWDILDTVPQILSILEGAVS
jgi:UDP-N-acetylglucosamine--N-acetylmuramyl-(pentapeptide) pyrophosphoryl-undecaprenol N-acetylglucosamine transferase